MNHSLIRLLAAAVIAALACVTAPTARAPVFWGSGNTPDGAIVNGGTPGYVTTAAGTWTFSTTQNGDGNWDIVLNGVDTFPVTHAAAVQLYILNGGVLYQKTVANAWFSWTGAGPWMATTDPRGSVISITSVNLSPTTFTPATPNAVVGTVSVTMSSGTFSGTLSIGSTGCQVPPCTNTGGFHLVGTTLEAKAIGGTAAGTYADFTIVATQSSASNSPQQLAPSVVGSAGGGGNVAVITLTNGPPNLPTGLLAAGLPSGSPVSDVYADMSPMSTAFSGTFNAPTGTNAGNFSISTATNCGSAGNLRCGKLITNGSLGAGTYNISLSTSLGGSQAVTVNVVDGVHAACPGGTAEIQNAINSAGTNGTVILAGSSQVPCTYHPNTEIQPVNGQTVIGGDQTATILDGAGGNCNTGGVVRADQSGAINNIWANMTWQNYPQCPQWLDGGVAVIANRGWIMRNIQSRNIGGSAVNANFPAFQIINSVFHDLGYGVGLWNANLLGADSTAWVIKGNEMYRNTLTMPSSGCGNMANFKELGPEVGQTPGPTINIIANYIHDSGYLATWFDTDNAGQHHVLTGNTLIHNSSGMFNEVSSEIDIGFNVFIDNGFQAQVCYSGQTNWGAVAGGEADNWNVHDNNISQQQGANSEELVFYYNNDGRGGGNTNIVFKNNTVTFLSNGCCALVANVNVGGGSFFDGNHYYVAVGSVNDTHFQWGGFTGNFSGIQGQGQENGTHGTGVGTIQTGNEQATDKVTGCRHVACTSAGIGNFGLPN